MTTFGVEACQLCGHNNTDGHIRQVYSIHVHEGLIICSLLVCYNCSMANKKVNTKGKEVKQDKMATC